MSENIDITLNQRTGRYGAFIGNAEIAQEFKAIVLRNGGNLQSVHREALDMILHKVARILNGDPNYVDNWHDIAGYALLVEKFLSEK
jgi:hypothetical protein